MGSATFVVIAIIFLLVFVPAVRFFRKRSAERKSIQDDVFCILYSFPDSRSLNAQKLYDHVRFSWRGIYRVEAELELMAKRGLIVIEVEPRPERLGALTRIRISLTQKGKEIGQEVSEYRRSREPKAVRITH
jgi:hypothetical protein